MQVLGCRSGASVEGNFNHPAPELAFPSTGWPGGSKDQDVATFPTVTAPSSPSARGSSGTGPPRGAAVPQHHPAEDFWPISAGLQFFQLCSVPQFGI